MKTGADFRNLFFCAVLSGVMLTASFPPLRFAWLAWIALVPLLGILNRKSPWTGFKIGFLFGFIHFITLTYWVVLVLDHYGGLPTPISVAVLVLFCLYLSVYPAIFSGLYCLLKDSRFSVLLLSCLWVGCELLRAKFLTGFPWCLLGYTQYSHLHLIQISDITGVYGVTFILLLVNGSISALVSGGAPRRNRFLKWELAPVLVILLGSLIYGYGRPLPPHEGLNPLRISILQGNIDQSKKWDTDFQDETITVYERLARSAAAFKPDLSIWPETAVPIFFQDRSDFSDRVTDIARDSNTEVIFGSPAYDQKNGATRYFNRAYALTQDGTISGFYDKTHLVPFGEYVPFKRFLPFIHRLVAAAGDFTPGEKKQPVQLSRGSAGILICFESIFPDIARAHVQKGANMLVNLTNDAWFGRTSAPHQHLSMAVFRAVENKRPLVRAANTGFSAFIGERGEIIEKSSLFKEEILTKEMSIGIMDQTIYTQYGDLFAFVATLFSILSIGYVLVVRKKIEKG